MKFSEKIIKIRKENGLSQEEFGNKINVSRQAISKWKSEQSQPEIEKVKEISKVFGVSIEYLLNDGIEEDIEIEKNKNNKNKLLKVVLKLLIVIVTVYLLYCLIKGILLVRLCIKANSIPEYESYTIYRKARLHDKFEDISYKNDSIETENCAIKYFYKEDFEIPNSIEYINLEKKKAYNLIYNTELNKYLYEDVALEDDNESKHNNLYLGNTIKEIAIGSIPDTISDILVYSLNPRVIVTIDYIQQYDRDGNYKLQEFSNNGRLFQEYIINDGFNILIGYEYSVNKNESITEPIEQFEYVLNTKEN